MNGELCLLHRSISNASGSLAPCLNSAGFSPRRYDLIAQRDIHVPASILKCCAVSREFSFSSLEVLHALRLEQRSELLTKNKVARGKSPPDWDTRPPESGVTPPSSLSPGLSMHAPVLRLPAACYCDSFCF